MDLDEWVQQERDRLAAQHLWRTLLPLHGHRGRTVQTPDGTTLLSFSSNDYLGMSSHPELANVVAETVREYGTSTASSRLLAGTAPHHLHAETALASFVQQPAAILFSSGYSANVGTIAALLSRDDLIVSDALNHASIIDGCRLSRATIERVSHGSVDSVRSVLKRLRSRFRHAIVITDALFSMDADVADLRSLRTVCDEHDAWLYVDEAHSLGVLGSEGRGLACEQNIVPDILVGTLGKSFGLAGAFVAGSHNLIQFLHNKARSFIYSTAVPPMLSLAIPTAVRLVQNATEQRARLKLSTDRIRLALLDHSQTVLPGPGPILPWILRTPETALKVSTMLLRQGILAQAVRPPTVEASRIRLVPTASHRKSDIDRLIEALNTCRTLE